jgi:hypothetical protein
MPNSSPDARTGLDAPRAIGFPQLQVSPQFSGWLRIL